MTTTGADWLDQARRLMETLRDSAAHGTTAQGTAPAPDPGTGSAADPGPEAPSGATPAGSDCRWCPLCQAAAMVRGERPELSAALADILATTAAALRTFAGQAAPAPDATAPDPTAPDPTAPDPTAPDAPASDAAEQPGPAPVQRIELS